MGSLLVAVRSLVIDALADLPEFAEAEVTFGRKVGSKRREKVWTQDIRSTHTPAGHRAAKTFRDENATFDLYIDVEGIAQTVEQTTTRAFEMGHAAEDWIATHANWQGQVEGLNWLQIEGDLALIEAFNDLGSVSQLAYPIAFRARLT